MFAQRNLRRSADASVGCTVGEGEEGGLGVLEREWKLSGVMGVLLISVLGLGSS
jgi:hypothetical protein